MNTNILFFQSANRHTPIRLSGFTRTHVWVWGICGAHMCAISVHIWVKYERVSCDVFVWCILVSIRGVYICGCIRGVFMRGMRVMLRATVM